MEKTTSIFTLVSQRWILCTLASFLGAFLLIFCLKFPSRLDFVSIESMTIATTTTQLKNFTANHTDDRIPAKYLTQLNGTKDEGLLVNEPKKKCDIFNGRWVYDPKASPLYKATQCPFLSDQVSCRKNGRPDFEYERWRWEAKDCEIPRLDGKEMLERLRGKRVIIVGDSLNRNQWESLACLLYSAVPSKRGAYINVHNGEYKIFKAKDYNCSVEFHWSPFLVQLESLDDTQSKKNSRILKLDKLSTSARRWRGADIMVFNTGHWWIHSGKLRAWDFFQHKGKLIEELDLETAYRFAMKAWAHWIDLNVDPVKTTVFFRSISPSHKGKQWCYNQTQPIKDESYQNSFPEPIIDILGKTIREMRTPVRYLNITKLSQYRKDAHPTVYTTKQGKLLTKEQREQPKLYADCNHWCLPGLPDTWNSLLFTSIILDSSRDIL